MRKLEIAKEESTNYILKKITNKYMKGIELS